MAPKKKVDSSIKDGIIKGAYAMLAHPTFRGYDAKQKSDELKKYLEGQDSVEGVSVYGNTDLTVKFIDKTQVGILLNRDKLYGGESGYSLAKNMNKHSSTNLDKELSPGTKKAAVIDTLGDDWPGKATPDAVKRALVTAGYSVDYVNNDKVTLEFLSKFDGNEYGVVFVRSHGGILNVDGDDKLHIMVRPMFMNCPPDSDYTGVGIFFIDTNVLQQGGKAFTYAINDQFVQKYMNDKRFPNSLFHLLVCHGADPLAEDDMIKSFLDRGVGCYTGWTKSASGTNGDPAARIFFQYLCDGSSSNTVKSAISMIASEGRSPDPKTGAILVAHGTDDMQIIDSQEGKQQKKKKMK
jgi:hypothetical protein